MTVAGRRIGPNEAHAHATAEASTYRELMRAPGWELLARTMHEHLQGLVTRALQGGTPDEFRHLQGYYQGVLAVLQHPQRVIDDAVHKED